MAGVEGLGDGVGSKQEAEDFLRKYVTFQVSNYLAADQKLEEAKTSVIKSWDRAVKRMSDNKKDDNYSMYLDAFGLALAQYDKKFIEKYKVE